MKVLWKKARTGINKTLDFNSCHIDNFFISVIFSCNEVGTIREQLFIYASFELYTFRLFKLIDFSVFTLINLTDYSLIRRF